jgi:hypothetical protein
MFPRKKRNRTGTISVVVVDKSRGGFKEVKSFGVAKTEEEADLLYAKASEWVRMSVLTRYTATWTSCTTSSVSWCSR